MNHYEFAMAPIVHAGPGSRAQLHQTLELRGIKHPLLITDENLAKTSVLTQVVEAVGDVKVFDKVKPDPSVNDVMKAVDAIRESGADGLIALGGGSSIDVAKLAGLLSTNALDLLKLADDWTLADKPGLPLLVIPTTVGSGSEMTRGAVFVDTAQAVKRVVVSDYMAARDVLLDPTLLSQLPRPVIASTGADALTQAIEGVISTAASAFTDALHLQALRMIGWALPRAYANPADAEAMGAMQEAAAMVGAGLARSGVGAAHAIANVLGGHYHIPHGVACGIMLRPVVRFNSTAVPSQCRAMADAMGLSAADGGAVIEAVQGEIERLLTAVQLTSRLRDFGVPREDLPKVAQEAATHSDMGTNPREATAGDVEALLLESW